MIATATFSCLLGIGITATTTPQCAAPTVDKRPSLTMQFTPSMPTQIAPTSTVYGAIMTSYLNAVDCDFVMVENIDNNPAQEGEFTAKTTLPVLTVYRVGCAAETAAVTRRDYQGFEPQKEAHRRIAIQDQKSTEEQVDVKRTASDTMGADTLLGIADQISSGIDPNNDNLTLRDFKYLRQINTALFALNVINSGLPLNQTCEWMHNAQVSLNLNDNLIDPQQAANIICFAAVYGIYFGMSNADILSDLAAIDYAILMNEYASQTLQQVCETLDYSAASFLGIGTDGIRKHICNSTAGTIHSSSTPAQTTMSLSTGNYQPTGTLFFPTASSNSALDLSSSIVFGTDGTVFSSATSAAGTVAPWYSTTVTAAAEVTTVTEHGQHTGSEPTLPPGVTLNSPSRVQRAAIRRHARGFY